MEQEELDVYNTLVTRAKTYFVQESSEPTQPTIPAKRSKRNTAYIKCSVHNPPTKKNDTWAVENSNCASCTLFNPNSAFPNGVLPTRRAIIELLIHMKQNNIGGGAKAAPAHWLISNDIALHWIFCNVYPRTPQNIKYDVDKLWSEYISLKDYVHAKKNTAYWERYNDFAQKLHLVPDYFEKNNARVKIQEDLWDCTMSDRDHKFHRQQIDDPPTGYCSTFVDNKWKRSQERKEARRNRSRKEYYEFVRESPQDEETVENDQDPTFEVDEPSSSTSEKRQKYEYTVTPGSADDDMPTRFRFLRKGQRSVRPEVYALMLKLKSSYHMSQEQAEAAIVETGNYLFGRSWEYYDVTKPTNANTLPASSNCRRIEPYMEAMTLASIVEELMNGSKAVMYANDGSAMSGVGSYVVQSITIDGIQRPLPTMAIFTESRESLEELEVMTLKMLLCSVNYKYTEKQLLERIDFVMTDSTSHNLEVIENVCERFGAEVPKTLLCNVHPLMMFQRKVKDIFQLLHDTLGKDRIVDCFLVDVDFAGEDFITKAIKCLTSFINKDNSAKPWNRQKHFDSFIAPKSNESISYKDHRFNRLFQCCMVLVHHINDISMYLDTFRNVVNGISILDRSFVEMTLLKPVFCAASLIGLHITIPFQALLISTETNYSTLLAKFPVLYEELQSIEPEAMCVTKTQVFHFVPTKIFENVLKNVKDVVLESLQDTVELYKTEVVNLLRLMLPRLAEGIALQRGKIFGFGPEAEDPSKTFKISAASEEEIQKLNKTSVHNLGEERSVGSINFELGIRGKRNLESASKKLLLKKSFDLLENSGKLSEFRKFRKAANDIKAMKINWNAKMKRMEEEGNLKKNDDNNHIENVKYNDLDYLKKRNGPFTSEEAVREFDRSTPESSEKNHRLYIEVRYAKNTCLSLKHTASVFRLMRHYKKLPSEEYVENLCQYLGDARSKTVLTADDLSAVLAKLNHDDAVHIPPLTQTPTEAIQTDNEMTVEESSPATSCEYVLDEHVVAVWIDEKDNELSWFLGCVASVSSETVGITYYRRKDRAGTTWTIPEEENDEDDEEPVSTPKGQIIYRNITIGFTQGRVLRYTIDKQTVQDISNEFSKYITEME